MSFVYFYGIEINFESVQKKIGTISKESHDKMKQQMLIRFYANVIDVINTSKCFQCNNKNDEDKDIEQNELFCCSKIICNRCFKNSKKVNAESKKKDSNFGDPCPFCKSQCFGISNVKINALFLIEKTKNENPPFKVLKDYLLDDYLKSLKEYSLLSIYCKNNQLWIICKNSLTKIKEEGVIIAPFYILNDQEKKLLYKISKEWDLKNPPNAYLVNNKF